MYAIFILRLHTQCETAYMNIVIKIPHDAVTEMINRQLKKLKLVTKILMSYIKWCNNWQKRAKTF